MEWNIHPHVIRQSIIPVTILQCIQILLDEEYARPQRPLAWRLPSLDDERETMHLALICDLVFILNEITRVLEHLNDGLHAFVTLMLQKPEDSCCESLRWSGVVLVEYRLREMRIRHYIEAAIRGRCSLFAVTKMAKGRTVVFFSYGWKKCPGDEYRKRGRLGPSKKHEGFAVTDCALWFCIHCVRWICGTHVKKDRKERCLTSHLSTCHVSILKSSTYEKGKEKTVDLESYWNIERGA